MEVDKDHIHLLVDYSPNVSISQIVRLLKQTTTARVWFSHSTELRKHFWQKHVFWIFCLFYWRCFDRNNSKIHCRTRMICSLTSARLKIVRFYAQKINDAKTYGKYIHEVNISIAKSRLLPEFKRGLNIGQIIANEHSNFKRDYENWNENYNKAYITALKTFNGIYDNKNYRNVLIRLWEDFYFDKSNIFLKEILGQYDGYIVEFANGIKHFMCYKPEIIKTIKVIDPESHQ